MTQPPERKPESLLHRLLGWTVIASIILLVLSFIINNGSSESKIVTSSYSTFLRDVDRGRVNKVLIIGQKIKYILKEEDIRYITTKPKDDPGLIGDLVTKNIEFSIKTEEQSFLTQIFISWFPFLLLIGVWIYFMKQQGMKFGGGKSLGGMGSSKAQLNIKSEITFDDIAGIEEVKEEVEELVEFLRNPDKFLKLGGKIPKGVLMTGQPGTGKTLLSKAVAGEANRPFFSISGSDFVEMFVGVGASRVRDLFDKAKKHAPCIIFIDEIDAVGRQRGTGLGGGHDEREQTLNQLLVEMDGFKDNNGVIVIAATNRPDILDPALLRPGRFDRHVYVPLPDIKGREKIFMVHMRGKPIAEDVDPLTLARGIAGATGADIMNICNEAAIFAARKGKELIDMDDFAEAQDKVTIGVARHSVVISDEQKKVTAYHESGHAIVGESIPENDPVHKVTIIPHSRAMGLTQFLPTEDKYGQTREELEGFIAICMGGRVAEEIFIGKISTGASNDFDKATEHARNMVVKFGMSNLGPRTFSENGENVFLGRDMLTHKNISDERAQQIDNEIDRILNEQYERARKILDTNRDKVEIMAHQLLKWETIDKDQVKDIINGTEMRVYESDTSGDVNYETV